MDRIERHERVCQLCITNDLEDEYHLVIKCPVYENIRRSYIKRYYLNNPSVYTFVLLLQSTKKKELVNLCKFLSESFAIRKRLIMQ